MSSAIRSARGLQPASRSGRSVRHPNGSVGLGSARAHGRNCSSAQQLAFSADAYQEMRMRSIIARNALGASEVVTSPPEASPAPPAPAADGPPISALDIRVGRIVKVERHPDAESLYVEQIDVGEPEPRTIVSGLVKYQPIEAMQDRPIIVLCNLKPRNMRGIKSNGMVLCASDSSHETVEPLRPPEGATPGERVWFGEDQSQAAPAEPNRVDKKKIWESLHPFLKTDDAKVAGFKGLAMMTSKGQVTADGLAGASIS